MIFGRHSVLKRGCSTWDPTQVPQTEFHSRLDAVRREMARQSLDALVIYGDNYSFADLCYLTNYFPKVRGGIAVVPREGAISLLLNIGSRDVPFAKTLTWVEDVRASNQVGADGAKLLKEKGFEKAKIGLMDSGLGFPLPQLEDMKGALPNVNWQACDAMIVPQRLVKTARELGAMREAGHLLSDICDGAHAFIKQGRKEYEVIADIDRLARDKGAEDIRILAGDKRLNPPSFKQSATPQPSLGGLFGGAARALLGRGGADFYFVQRCETSSGVSKDPRDCRADGGAAQARRCSSGHR